MGLDDGRPKPVEGSRKLLCSKQHRVTQGVIRTFFEKKKMNLKGCDTRSRHLKQRGTAPRYVRSPSKKAQRGTV